MYSVLDQRRHSGTIIVDGLPRDSSSPSSAHPAAKSLWHGNVGYTFANSDGKTSLTVQVGQKTGNWSAIGISAQPPAAVDLFAAWIEHQGSDYPPVAYTVFPGTSFDDFAVKSITVGDRLKSLQNDEHVSAVYDGKNEVLMAIFWDADGGSITFSPDVESAPVTMSVDGNMAVVYKLQSGVVTVSDPSQSLSTATVTLSLGDGASPERWKGSSRTNTLNFALPGGGLAGSSVTLET